MKSKPGEELALWLSKSGPNLVGSELREAPHEILHGIIFHYIS
jgi:hypothetical protein